MPRLNDSIDIAALDIFRDRERGLTRFNELRRQIGMQSLRGFNDFADIRLAETDTAAYAMQMVMVDSLRAIYGTHTCNDSLVISRMRGNEGQQITDCLGYANGTEVDNIEDVDLNVGMLAESVRPHGYAISQTQFVIFILNASRRIYSDRFFTSSFRHEFYSHLGVEWVTHNGPDRADGQQQVEHSPMKGVLLRNLPELRDELGPVVNAFDPWARDRGEHYSLEWSPRDKTTSDPSFDVSASTP